MMSLLLGCGTGGLESEARVFLDQYTSIYLDLYARASEAEWRTNTFIKEGDEETAAATRATREALAAFTGSVENIEAARRFLRSRDALSPVQVKQFEAILYEAGNNPQTVPDLVKARIDAETAQTEKLYGFDFQLNGVSVSTNRIDEVLRDEQDPARRLEAWSTSKEVGRGLKDGLVKLRDLRNRTVQALGYEDFFTYQVSDYGMTTDEMVELNRRLIREVWPLYRELHTYARYELAERYGVSEVPAMLPAHWLPNRWGQDWSAMVSVEGIDLDGALKDKEAAWIVEQGEEFYVSMGFPKLPGSFWERSSLYPLPEDADYKKNNHASAWHMDLQDDVRCLMSVVPNAEWYETVHHELGHIYYYISYTNPDVPPLLRKGANRAFHEAVGSLLGLAAMQRPFLAGRGLVSEGPLVDQNQALLKEALNYIVFIPWSAGVMTDFERRLYEGLEPDRFNTAWWELKRRYQGIEPPGERGEEYCDAASKTHISDDAAQYYDYALSFVILFQLHDHISREILRQHPTATDYFGDEEAGNFLRRIMTPGAREDWRQLMVEVLGEEISAEPMLRYFEPLRTYLEEINQGREHTLPEVLEG